MFETKLQEKKLEDNHQQLKEKLEKTVIELKEAQDEKIGELKDLIIQMMNQ